MFCHLPAGTDGAMRQVTANKAIELSTGEFVMPFWRERALLGGNGACQQLRGSPGAGVLVSEDRCGADLSQAGPPSAANEQNQ